MKRILERGKGGSDGLLCSLEAEAFVDVLAYRCAVTGFEEHHVSESRCRGLATTADVFGGLHPLEVDVPATEFLLGYDELLRLGGSGVGDLGVSDLLV